VRSGRAAELHQPRAPNNAGATIVAENGTSDLQLMAIFNWTRTKIRTLYMRLFNRRKLSQDAVLPIVPRTENETKQSYHPAERIPLKKLNTINS
jgi:uncharacterized protein (DUF2132 family)